MPENGSFARYELKIVYPQPWISEVRGWITGHPVGFVTAFPPRWVNSFYFDTPDLDSFNDHLAGVPERRKLRFRWYGESLQTGRGQVEVKNKTERVGWKDTHPIEYTFDFEKMDWSSILSELQQQSSGFIRELLSVVQPALLTAYWREYFISSDGIVRLTLDSDLCAYDQRFTAQPNLWFRQPLEDDIFVELKSEVPNAPDLADILAHFPSRVERHSKYVDALEKMMGFY
jgi:SPX domain protein involved in polyphosphate accumulation